MKTVQEAEALTKAYELAVTQKCVPPPVIEVVGIATTPGVHPPGYVVAVNVYPMPMGPVGVRWESQESFRFPLRTATQTHWMPPTELAMLMVPKIRRVAILLDRIPPAQRSDVAIQHSNSAGSPLTHPAHFVGIDPELTTATFVSVDPSRKESTIPLDRITSVWRRDANGWYIAVNGLVSVVGHGGFIFRPH